MFGKRPMSNAGSRDHPNVVAFPPLLLLGCAALSILFHRVRPYRLTETIPLWWVGILLALAAIAQLLFARRAMVAAGTNIRPSLPSKAIVRTGPFRYTRNPMYLSLCVLQLSLVFF